MNLDACFSEKSMFFADSQLMHGPNMPIFESVRAIPSTDVVQTFERDPLSGSQVRVHTNIKKRQKQIQPKLIPSVKLRFSGGNKHQSLQNSQADMTGQTVDKCLHNKLVYNKTVVNCNAKW